jgi:uncharacterized protein (TIGR00255 family)
VTENCSVSGLSGRSKNGQLKSDADVLPGSRLKMVKSMTAFSRAEITQSGLTIIIEIRSYNGRYLDIVFNLPHELHCLEDKIKKHISSRIVRGHVSIRIDLKKTDEDTKRYDVDTSKALAYYKALSRLKTILKIDGDISLDLILGAGDIIISEESEAEPSVYWMAIEPCLNHALTELDTMKRREGRFLHTDLNQRMNFIKESIERIEKTSSNLLSYYQERLKDRISQLTQGIVALDPSRVAQEAAILADKSDISEEIVRVKSHIDQFRQILDDDQPAGRRLNFMLQEFNREFNTIGSKTANTGVSYTVVDVKSEIEKIREQVQNIE